MRNICGEWPNWSHSRTVWKQDEERLLACLTLDTASKRDAALIVLMARTGFRTASVARIRLDIHVHVGVDIVRLVVPDVKRSNMMEAEAVFVGADAVVLRRWIDHRKMIFPESQLMFLNGAGKAITCDCVTRMLDRLSVAAGYGKSFFTAHSFRVGFATKVAAKTFCNGGTEQTVRDSLYSTGQWDRASQAVNAYIDGNVRNFFSSGLGLTWEEFEGLEPSELHDLTHLRPLQKRPLTWFCHSEDRLIRICSSLGFSYPGNQTQCRRLIGEVLLSRSASFRDFVAECMQLRGSDVDVLANIVGCLLEEEEFDIGRWMRSPERDELRDAVVITSYPLDESWTTRKVQKVHVYPLFNRRQAQRIVGFLAKRLYDRKTHIGRLPNGELVLLKVRGREGHCREAQLPAFDLDATFPPTEADVVQMDLALPDESPDSDPIGLLLREDDVPGTPVNAASSRLGQTPSTAASSLNQTPARPPNC